MPIEIIPDRICSHCGGNKWGVYKIKDTKYYQYKCVLKQSERLLRYYNEKIITNPEKLKKVRQYYLNYKNNDKERFIIQNRKKSKKSSKTSVKNLTNYYIISTLLNDKKIKKSDITPELIQLKKQSICLYRKRKELSKQKM